MKIEKDLKSTTHNSYFRSKIQADQPGEKHLLTLCNQSLKRQVARSKIPSFVYAEETKPKIILFPFLHFQIRLRTSVTRVWDWSRATSPTGRSMPPRTRRRPLADVSTTPMTPGASSTGQFEPCPSYRCQGVRRSVTFLKTKIPKL